MNENTYDFDPKNPKNSWLYGAFLAFQKLKKAGLVPKSFATIGTGSGLDSVGANKIFNFSKIYQTDIHPNVINIAQKNTSNYINKDTQVQTFLGNLCTPLIQRGIRVDLLYANIPNIPSEKPVWEGKISSSRFQLETNDTCPEIFNKWLLTLQYQFLKEAKNILNTNGAILIAIGDRIPQAAMQQLFEDNGYKSTELVNIYKIQTEPEEVLIGYAEQEAKEGIKFDFYDHEKAFPVWQNKCEGRDLSVVEMKGILQEFRLSAISALQEFREKGRSAGHLYSIFKLVV